MSAYLDVQSYHAMSPSEQLLFDAWVDTWHPEQYPQRAIVAIAAVPDGSGLAVQVTQFLRDENGNAFLRSPDEIAKETVLMRVAHWPNGAAGISPMT